MSHPNIPDPNLLHQAAAALRNYALILPPGCPNWHNTRRLANELARTAVDIEGEQSEPTEVTA